MPTFWLNTDGKVLVDGSGNPYDCPDCPCCPCCDFDNLEITLAWTSGPPVGSIGNPYWVGPTKVDGVCTWTAVIPIEDNPDYSVSAVLEWHCDNDGAGNPGWRVRCVVTDIANACFWTLDEISTTVACGPIDYSGSHDWTGSGGACSNYTGSTVSLDVLLNP